MIRSTLSPSDAATCRAVVGLTPPLRLADGAASGNPVRAISSRIAGCAGQRSATVVRPALTAAHSGASVRFGSTSVNGPGQNAAASSRARSSNSASLSAMARLATWTISGVEVRPALGSENPCHCGITVGPRGKAIDRLCRHPRPNPPRRSTASAVAIASAGTCAVFAQRIGGVLPAIACSYSPIQRNPRKTAQWTLPRRVPTSCLRSRSVPELTKLPPATAFLRHSPDLVAAIVEGIGGFAAGKWAPLNRIGDTVGARLADRICKAAGWLCRSLPRLCRCWLECDFRPRSLWRSGSAVFAGLLRAGNAGQRQSRPSRCCRCSLWVRSKPCIIMAAPASNSSILASWSAANGPAR